LTGVIKDTRLVPSMLLEYVPKTADGFVHEMALAGANLWDLHPLILIGNSESEATRRLYRQFLLTEGTPSFDFIDLQGRDDRSQLQVTLERLQSNTTFPMIFVRSKKLQGRLMAL
jgi:hypothetical protein